MKFPLRNAQKSTSLIYFDRDPLGYQPLRVLFIFESLGCAPFLRLQHGSNGLAGDLKQREEMMENVGSYHCWLDLRCLLQITKARLLRLGWRMRKT